MHRMTLRTGARDTKSVRTISLMERSCSKSARRISPISSTPIIPISPSQPTEAKGKDADTQRQRGSLLDAKIAPQGVIIASEFTRWWLEKFYDAFGLTPEDMADRLSRSAPGDKSAV